MAAKDKNGPGNNKAYMPVPKGYKGNWNVPKGTPWKKDSPYNPANKNKGPTSRGPSPDALAEAKKKASLGDGRAVSRTPSPAAIKSAKAKATAREAASYKASDDKMMRMAKQKPGKAYVVPKKPQGSQNKGTSATAGRAADAKRMSSPTSRVTKHPEGHKSGSAPYVKPATISPADRKASMANIKRAAQTNRANKAASAKASASRTSKSVVTGAANKMRRFS